MVQLQTMVQNPSHTFIIILMSLSIKQGTTQAISSSNDIPNDKTEKKIVKNLETGTPLKKTTQSLPIINPCNIEYLPSNNRIYQFNETSDTKFRVEAYMENDNRPCNLSITKPGEKDPVVLNFRKEKDSFYNENNIQLVVRFKKLVKIYFYKDEEGKTFRGIYKISNLTYFAFPKQLPDDEIAELPVEGLTCTNKKLMGRVNMTEDFHFCCEYHRLQNPPIPFIDEGTSSMVNCCKNCIDVNDSLNVTINYNDKYLDFVKKEVKQEDQYNPLYVACTIQEGALYSFKMEFKAIPSKATPTCLVENNEKEQCNKYLEIENENLEKENEMLQKEVEERQTREKELEKLLEDAKKREEDMINEIKEMKNEK